MTAAQSSAARAHDATPTPFNPINHPVIAKHLVNIGARDTLHLLRGVSQAYRDMCDAALVRNLFLELKTPRLGRLEAAGLVYIKPPPEAGGVFEEAAKRIYPPSCPKVKIAPLQHLQDCTEPGKVPTHVKRVLGFVRNLDISWSTAFEEKGWCADVGRKSAVALCAALAPFLTNINTIRITQERDTCWPSELPFSAHRLILRGQVLEKGESNVFPKLPVFKDISELVVMVSWRESTEKRIRALPSFPSSVRSVVVAIYNWFLYEGNIETYLPVILKGAVDFRHLINTSTELSVTGVHGQFDWDEKAQNDEHIERLRKSLPIQLPNILKDLGFTDEETNQVRYSIPSMTEIVHKFGDGGVGAICGNVLSPINAHFELEYRVDPAFFVSLEKLEDALLRHTHPFTTNGSVHSRNPLTLYFTDQEGKILQAAVPLSGEDVARLHAAGLPSSFGRGQELVYDESYRSAREIKPPNFSLSGDVLADGAVLSKIERAMSAGSLSAVLSKLNIYAKGGFFKPHRDTPRGENHLGTLTLCLPSTFTGGELIVKHGGVTKVSDWANSTDVSWTFLYSDCEHEVLPVTSGMRVTIAYDIFVNEESQVAAAPSDTLAAGTLNMMLADPLFMPFGGVLAFGLQHEYPSADEHDIDLRAMLKGGDALWADALDGAGISYEILAVYRHVEPAFASQQETYKNRRLAVSRDFNGYNGDRTYDIEYPPFSQVPVKNLHWVTTPGAWGVHHAYATYGNEPGAQLMYMSVAIYAYVGPYAARGSFNATTFKDVKRDHRDGDDEGHYDTDNSDF